MKDETYSMVQDYVTRVFSPKFSLDVVHSQQGTNYSSVDELVEDVRADELDLTHLYSWGDSYDGQTEEVEEPQVTTLKNDDRVVVQARVEAEEGEAWLQLNSVEFRDRWEDLL